MEAAATGAVDSLPGDDSKDELAEIARSGYPETADEDPRRAAEAVGLFISGTIAYLDRTACNSVAPLCYAVTPVLRRNRCTVTGAVTASLFGREAVLHQGAGAGAVGRQMRQDSVAVLDCDFRPVTLKGDHPLLYVLI